VELVLALFYDGICAMLGQQPHKLPFISSLPRLLNL
jgi:hypothetical protein